MLPAIHHGMLPLHLTLAGETQMHANQPWCAVDVIFACLQLVVV